LRKLIPPNRSMLLRLQAMKLCKLPEEVPRVRVRGRGGVSFPKTIKTLLS